MVQAMHKYFLTCKHTMSFPLKTNDERLQSTYPVLTHRLGKSLKELMSYKLSRKDRMCCHCTDCMEKKKKRETLRQAQLTGVRSSRYRELSFPLHRSVLVYCTEFFIRRILAMLAR